MWSERLCCWVAVIVALTRRGWADTPGVVTSCPVVERSEWGASPPVSTPLNMTLPVPYVVIHHSYIPSACGTREACLRAMKTMQHMHQIVNKWNDIGYNFAVGNDGHVYEGRGWDVVGAHAPKYNFMSVGICFIGDYMTQAPSAPMLEAAQRLILCGITRGSILANYTLVGHRQVRETECPGGALFQVIQRWLHWKPIRDIQPRVPPHRKPSHNTETLSDTASQSTLDPSPNTTDQSALGIDNKPAPSHNSTDQSTLDTSKLAPSLNTTDQSALVIDNKPAIAHNSTDQSTLDTSKLAPSLNTTDQSAYNTNTTTSISPSAVSPGDKLDISNNTEHMATLINRNTNPQTPSSISVPTFSNPSKFTPGLNNDTSNASLLSNTNTDASTHQTSSTSVIITPANNPNLSEDNGTEISSQTTTPSNRTPPSTSESDTTTAVGVLHDTANTTANEISDDTVDQPASEDTNQ